MFDKFTMVPEDTLLMVIDIQERLVSTMTYGDQVIQNTNILLAAADTFSMPVVVTEQYPKGLWNTVSALELPEAASPVFEKLSFTGCTPEVVSQLKTFGKNKIILTGMETHVCVLQTARELLAQGYQVFVAMDAVCSRRTLNYRNALNLMAQMGAVVTNTETLVFDLLKRAGTPEFKRLSKLIK
jgi:nicotinamidase-related amidase